MPDVPATPELLFNPFAPEFRRDPYTALARLREEAPFYETPLGFTVLSRYADCAAMLRDPRSSSDQRKTPRFRDEMTSQGLDPDQVIAESTAPFLFQDPPDHTRLRGLVNRAFTPRVVETLRPRIQEIVDALLDAVAGRGELDVIEDLAYPLPVLIISEMLGVPPKDHEIFRDWSKELARSLDPDFALPAEVMAARQRAVEELSDYFRKLIADHRTHPKDDLMSSLIAAEDGGASLSENELLSTCVLLLIAGHETTVNLIGNGALALRRHPEQWQRLYEDPGLIKSAVEELLRYDPPVQLTGRNALEDIALETGTLRAGESAVLLLGSANRDPRQFTAPDALDLGRADNRHLAFGMGIHFCLGAPLARVEGQIALGAMTRRLRGAALAVEQPEYKENITLRGLASLPVRFEGVVAR